MNITLKPRPEVIRSAAINTDLLIKAVKVQKEVTDYFRAATGPLPETTIEIVPALRSNAAKGTVLARLDFTGNQKRLLLSAENSSQQELESSIAHEVTHYARLYLLGKLYQEGPRKALEEACAIYAEASFASRESAKEASGANQAMIVNYLKNSYTYTTGAFEAALKIIYTFEASGHAQLPGTTNPLTGTTKPKYFADLDNLHLALTKAKKETSKATRPGTDGPPPEYIIGAGLALIFAMLNADNQKTLKLIFTSRMEDLERNLIQALTDNKEDLVRRIDELRKGA